MSSKWNIKTLKEYFERIISEKDKALDAALVAQKAAVTAAFAASDKAITKSEEAQKDYNARSNEFRAALDDQAKRLMPRSEAETNNSQLRELIDAQSKQIAELQNARAEGRGGQTAAAAYKSNTQWTIVLTVTIAIAALTGIGTLIFYLATRH